MQLRAYVRNPHVVVHDGLRRRSVIELSLDHLEGGTLRVWALILFEIRERGEEDIISGAKSLFPF